MRQALATAAQEGWSRILLCDTDFADWPLGDREVVAALNAWSARGRSLHLLARDYSVLRQTHPRFVQWRITWSHLVEAQACASASADELPSVLWSPGWTLERLDTVRCTMVASRSAERARGPAGTTAAVVVEEHACIPRLHAGAVNKGKRPRIDAPVTFRGYHPRRSEVGSCGPSV